MRIAVIGSGISGLAAAWLLRHAHDVTLIEKRHRLGGHSNTVVHRDPDGRDLALDTGFLVYNERTYPLLTRLFEHLSVETRASDMSFGVSCARPDVEYAVSTLRSILAQPENAVRPWFYGFLSDLTRFGRRGREILRTAPDPTTTVADFIAHERFGEAFEKLYLLPMVAAIWSSGTHLVREFPRDALLRFFDNHGLLSVNGRPQWRTVVDGSRSYVERMARDLAGRIRLGVGVETVERTASEVVVRLENGASHRFDHVVIASHADQALAMLAEPTADERELLGAWSYSANDTWLHTDTSLLPRRRAAWAAWNYLLEERDASEPDVTVSYHLNRLQGIDGDRQYVVTLNPRRAPAPATVIRRMTYHHPVYSRDSVATQADLPKLNGVRRTHFCGAYQRNGFHEDGLWSAVRVASELGVEFP